MGLTAQIDQHELDRVIESEWAYLLSEVDQWSLLRGEQDMGSSGACLAMYFTCW